MLAKFRSAVSKLRVRQREAARRQTQRRTLRAEPLEGRLLMTVDSWVVPMGVSAPSAYTYSSSEVDMDSVGNAYLAATADGGVETGADLFLAKYLPSGKEDWSYRFPITGNQRVWTATVASDGFYVAGTFAGTVDFDPSPGVGTLPTPGGSGSSYLAKYSLAGEFLWVRQFEESLRGVAAKDGNVYAVGVASVQVSKRTTESRLTVFKLSGDGATCWNSAIGVGVPSDLAIFTPPAGGPTHLYVAGDGFVMELVESADGNSVSQGWTTSPLNAGGHIAVQGEVIGDGLEPRIYVPSGSGTLVKLDAFGNMLWSQQVVSDALLSMYDVGVDGNTVYVAGSFEGSANFDRNAANAILFSRGDRDGFIARYDLGDGHLTHVQRLGGAGFDYPLSIAVTNGSLLTSGLASPPDADFLASGLDEFGQTQMSAFVPVSTREIYTMRLNVAAPIVYNVSAVTNSTTVTLYAEASAGTIAWYESGQPLTDEDEALGFQLKDLPVGVHQIAAIATDGDLIGMAGVVVTVTGDTKFYVVDDNSANTTFEYDANGTPVESYSLNTANTAPRGAASTEAGDTTWVVDANRKVYVYDTSGSLLRSWTVGTLSNKAKVEGITVYNNDVWIVDAYSRKVYKYANGASASNVTLTAASYFALDSSNTNPKDLVTDGTNIWVVDDGTPDRVFKYSMTGSSGGNWTIYGAGGLPTGITLDPSNVSQDLWIVDNGTDKVYQYTNGRAVTSGTGQTATMVFSLAPGNTNPQGIADPPAPSSVVTTETFTLAEPVASEVALVDNDTALEDLYYYEPPRNVRVDHTPRAASHTAVIDVSAPDYSVGAAPNYFISDNRWATDDDSESDVDDLFAEWDSDPLELVSFPDLGS